ncbi:hypothetical protein KEM60_02572 [Austwickia sp. TVS 96-490-7B]|nr:hypothetical protein [Austwickia sp. TVS 96-490-7B]
MDILIGGFPCQDVSTVGKRAGLAPGTRSGLWAHMAAAIDVLQPEWVVIENVRGLLSSPAARPAAEGDDHERRNRGDATAGNATLRGMERNPWHLGDNAARPLRALGAVLGDLADLRLDARGSAYQLRLSALLTNASASSPSPGALFRTPLATDSSRGGETLDQVRARRGTIALSHQIIDFALHGPSGSPSRRAEPETLCSLIGGLFSVEGVTVTPPPVGTHHRMVSTRASPPERRRRPTSTRLRRMAHGIAPKLGHRHRRSDVEPADHRAWQRSAASPGGVRTVDARRVNVGYERAASSGAPGAFPRAASRRVRIRRLRCSKNDVKSVRSSGRPSRSFSVR